MSVNVGLVVLLPEKTSVLSSFIMTREVYTDITNSSFSQSVIQSFYGSVSHSVA